MPLSTKPKILVVNDDSASLLALSSLLTQRADDVNYEVVTASSGQDALRQVLLHDFAVILLDVNMPGMDGFETAEAIHQRGRSAGIPIIFVTAFLADEIDRLKAYQKGAVDFLFTPVIPQILHAKVGVFVALASKNVELQQQAQTLSQRTTLLIAANKRLTREMEERKAAERKNHAKDEFLAMLGHELRNPLSAISSAAALIGLRGRTDDHLGRAAAIIERQTQHLSRIVDDLLDLSRAMSGKLLLTKQALDFGELVASCLDTFKATGRSKDYTVRLHRGPGHIDGDQTRIEQVVTNLIDNALKYTPPGGEIDISTETMGEHIVLTVGDTGVGIGPDLLPHVFDVFVQGTSTLDRAQGGLGIGLALVRRLVELHGGSVSARSEGEGQGSTFVVRLPSISAQARPQAALVRPQGSNKPVVLLIEDNDDGREMMATMLTACGHQIHHAADGTMGVQLAQDCHPDVALVDIGLPGIDGYEVARRLRTNADTQHIKLIALTGYGLATDQRRVLDAGFDMHLVKPVEIDHLLNAISQCSSN